MSSLIIAPVLPPTSPEMIDKLTAIQGAIMQEPQVPIFTQHVLHGGIYSRTITMPPMTKLVGAHMKIPTLVITVGSGKVLVGEKEANIAGYNVLPASADRKQIFVSLESPLIIMMLFKTDAQTVDEAEHEFTDEYDLLLSHRQSEMNEVTGDQNA